MNDVVVRFHMSSRHVHEIETKREIIDEMLRAIEFQLSPEFYELEGQYVRFDDVQFIEVKEIEN